MVHNRARAGLVVLTVGIVLSAVAAPARAQEPLRTRRNFIGMHNLKDGGVEFREGMDWTKNLSGGTGYVFDWVFDYSPTSSPHWIEEAMKRGLVPCVRVQEGAGGDMPDAGYAGQVAAQIIDWKLSHPQYADRYVYMQLWNEPGDPRDYVPMDVYADYMVQAYAAVHAAEASGAAINPNIAGTLKTMTPGQNNPDSWRIGLQHNPNCAFAFDVWGTHPYPESYPPHYNMHEGHGFVTKHKMIDSYLRDLDVFAEYGRRGFPVMITETAYGDHLGISYEGYPKTTRAMAADYNVAAFGTWWYRWPELIAVHPYILNNFSWEAFAWVQGGSGSLDSNGDGVREPNSPYPQYTAVRQLRMNLESQGKLAPARLSPYRGAVGTIQGTVTRADTGAPVKYANLYTDGFEFGGPSLYDGMYVVRDVPVGTYTLTCEKRGYRTAAQTITVSQGQTTTASFSLLHTGKVPEGIYFVDCGAPGLACQGNCPGCSLYATSHGQTFVTPSDVGFITFAAAKPNVGDLRLRFTIIEGGTPYGAVVGSFESAYLEPALGGEMIGGEAPGDGIPVQPNTTYFLKVERTDGQGVYLYTSNSDPYPGGYRWVGDSPQTGWDLYGTIRGATVAVVTATGTLAGTVRDTEGAALAGATIALSPGGYSATSGADGTYTITNVPEGPYTATATKSGYASHALHDVQIDADQTTTADFSLEAGPTTGTLTGTVKDTANNPLAGALVQTTPSVGVASADGTGVYTIENVPIGTYSVRASKSGYLAEQVDGVHVDGGAIVTLPFTLVPEAPFAGIQNGSFEGAFVNAPDADHRVGTAWQRFIVQGASKSGGHWDPTNHSPNWSQAFWEASWIAGVYQQAPYARADGLYTGGVWVRGAGITFWIGIDPSGGTVPTAASVQWSAPLAGSTTWQHLSKQITAQGSTLTLFLKAQNPSAANQNAFFDDASLTQDYVPPAAPTIGRTPALLNPTVVEGGDAPAGSFSVFNTGDGTLHYTITDSADWISVTPASGASNGESAAISVHYATASLPPGTHNAAITISDPAATNNPQTIAVTLTVSAAPSPDASADFDHDGDVDITDFGFFQMCFNGPNRPSFVGGCGFADLDGDGDVDLADFGGFQTCFNGANRPPAEACP